jgi:hypothetical protein
MPNLIDTLNKNGVNVSTLSTFADTGEGLIHTIVVNGDEAIPLWHKLRGLVEETGCWPVLIGNESFFGYKDLMENRDHSVSKTIEAGLAIDAVKWLERKGADYPQDSEPDETDLSEEFGDEFAEYYSSDVEPVHDFLIPYDVLSRKPLTNLHIALVPTKVCWQVPAYINNGGWNDCPYPEAHISLMKRWNEIYDAEIVGMAGDVFEFFVSKPPTDEESALVLAKEQYLYCSDIVDQGTMSVNNLAKTLLNSNVWYFWWD